MMNDFGKYSTRLECLRLAVENTPTNPTGATVDKAKAFYDFVQGDADCLDPDVLAKFRATGDGWQGRINEILTEAKL